MVSTFFFLCLPLYNTTLKICVCKSVYLLRTVFLKLPGLWPTLTKLKTSKSFCLCGLDLTVFTILEIKTENVSKSSIIYFKITKINPIPC